MKDRKQVTIKGITWTILSANERVCTVKGRHFFASRCRSKTPWYLREHDCDITASATGAREVGYLPYRLETDHLSLAVLDITREAMELPIRPADSREPLGLLTQPVPIFYLLRIGAIEAVAAKCECQDEDMYVKQNESRQRLVAVIIAGLETQGNRVFSLKQVTQFVADGQDEYGLPDWQCQAAIKTIMDWQRRRIAARAGN